MPESLDPTTVDPAPQALPWELAISREVWESLLERLRTIPSTDALVDKIKKLGAGRPVDLTRREEAVLYKVARDWEHEVGSAHLPPAIRELRGGLRNFVLAYSRGEVEIQWESQNLLLDRLRRYPSAAPIVTALETPDAAQPLRLTDEQMAVLRDVVAEWADEIGVSRLPPGAVRLRGALDEHIRDVRRRDSRA